MLYTNLRNRTIYLEQLKAFRDTEMIKAFRDTEMIKVITGIRRCGNPA